MPRPPTAEPIVRKIENLWEENKHPPAHKVHALARQQKIEGCPSLRKVQQIIRDAKKLSHSVPEDPPLQPWGTGWPEAPEDIDCLYRLTLCALLQLGRYLTTREAQWALKLRGLFSVAGLDPAREFDRTYEHLVWAAAYARRKRAAEVLGRESPYTADLDGVMMFRVWESEAQMAAYREAVRQGLITAWTITTELESRELWDPGCSERFWRLLNQLSESAAEESHERQHQTTV